MSQDVDQLLATVREALARAIERTRSEYGFPDIEKRYSAALLSQFFLRDAVALLAALDAIASEIDTLQRKYDYMTKHAQSYMRSAEAAEAERDRAVEAGEKLLGYWEPPGRGTREYDFWEPPDGKTTRRILDDFRTALAALTEIEESQ
jgi:hypothetical protein